MADDQRAAFERVREEMIKMGGTFDELGKQLRSLATSMAKLRTPLPQKCAACGTSHVGRTPEQAGHAFAVKIEGFPDARVRDDTPCRRCGRSFADHKLVGEKGHPFVLTDPRPCYVCGASQADHIRPGWAGHGYAPDAPR